MALVSSDQVVPAPPDKCRCIHGYPEASWINYITWASDNRHIAFTVRSPGGPADPPREPLQLWLADTATGLARRILDPLKHKLNTVLRE